MRAPAPAVLLVTRPIPVFVAAPGCGAVVERADGYVWSVRVSGGLLLVRSTFDEATEDHTLTAHGPEGATWVIGGCSGEARRRYPGAEEFTVAWADLARAHPEIVWRKPAPPEGL